MHTYDVCIQSVALQAPVSDRESLNMTLGDHSTNISHAQTLLDQQKGDEMMPRSAFWAPITAKRFLSLFAKDGDDDFFSSDLTDKELIDRLGHVGSRSGLQLLSAYSSKDEYVPSSVDKDLLLKRLVSAMNNNNDETKVAEGLMLETGNHNLSEGDGDKERFVEAFGKLLSKSQAEKWINQEQGTVTAKQIIS